MSSIRIAAVACLCLAALPVSAGQLRIVEHSMTRTDTGADFSFTFDRPPEFDRVDEGKSEPFDTFKLYLDIDGELGVWPFFEQSVFGYEGVTGSPFVGYELDGHVLTGDVFAGEVLATIETQVAELRVRPLTFNSPIEPYDPQVLPYTLVGTTLTFSMPAETFADVDGFGYIAFARGTSASLPAANFTPFDWDFWAWVSSDEGTWAGSDATYAISRADFNLDGDVDAFDLGMWQSEFAHGPGNANSDGDADWDGDVDAFDLGIWQSQFGFVSRELAAAGPPAIPEPGAAIVLVMTLAARRRKRLPLVRARARRG